MQEMLYKAWERALGAARESRERETGTGWAERERESESARREDPVGREGGVLGTSIESSILMSE